MDQQMTEAGYLGINALGTIVAAIGATPGHAIIPDQWKNDFSIIGNALQAAGNTGKSGSVQVWTQSETGRRHWATVWSSMD
ncbi:hypothetical protein ABNN70_02650 [Sporolactobacillus sp. Y61]|uniref:Uncharacterized protein n=1 Tax=Sporolactobacillus sp. Y61 TaxID=3160863 RepID=A0AAU8IH89_9BACL